MDDATKKRIEVWLNGNYDARTKEEIKRMMREDEAALNEAFYKTLEFGTGGLRGIMGVGTNRMNPYTVGTATQGLANYLKKVFPDVPGISVAIAYDSRNNNRLFANTAADVLSANGIRVYVFDDIRPTPELSFAVRHLGCKAGIVITASHNPPEYNGYKVYWEDGGQLVPPHDKNVIAEVNKIRSIDEVRFERNEQLISSIGEEIDKEYMQRITQLSLSPEAIRAHRDLKIVYTPIHGTGVKLVPETLRLMGFENVIHVPEQDVPDGNFPTVKSPNPEESSALAMAIEKAKQTQADMVMATDPDADRIGLAIRLEDGEYELLNGNQTASLLIYYLLTKWKENKLIEGKEFIVKTIVTTELLSEIAATFGVKVYDTLTGFKYIAERIRLLEGKEKFIGGGEESYGYLVGDFVRDKDAVISAVMIAEMTAWAKQQGKSLKNLLQEIYLKHHFYKERLVSLVRKGIEGAAEIQQLMKSFREHPPQEINGQALVMIKDFLSGEGKDLANGEVFKLDLPSSNVLQFFLADGSKISIRPSGTEPKIKFYFSVKETLDNMDSYAAVDSLLNQKLDALVASVAH